MLRHMKMPFLLIPLVAAAAVAGCGSLQASEPESEPVQTTATVTVTESASVEGSSAARASAHLETMGITIEPNVYVKLADVVCDGLENGDTARSLANAVTQAVGTEPDQSAHLVVVSTAYTCPRMTTKLVE